MAKKPAPAAKAPKRAPRKAPEPAPKAAPDAGAAAAGTVDVGTLAKLFDCDVRTIQNLARQGIAEKAGHGRYVTAATIRNYVKHLRERAAGRESEDSKVSAVTESALFKRSQTRLNDMKIAQLEGRLVDLETIEEAWGLLAVANRQLFLAVPGRIAEELPLLTAADINAVAQVVHDMLTEAAFQGRVKVPTPNEEAA